MAQVIQFPAKVVRDWRMMEESIRRILLDGDADATAIEAIVDRMKGFFELCTREFSATSSYELPSLATPAQRESVNAALQGLGSQFATWLHQFTAALLVDRLKVEIELYFAQHPRD